MGKKKPIGRPVTVHGKYDKARQLGRVSDEDWAELQQAAFDAGLKFTQWAVPILLRAARRKPKE